MPSIAAKPLGVKGQMYDVPLAHYQGIYEKLLPQEAAERCGLVFTGIAEGGYFHVRLMGTEYRAAFPSFELRSIKDGSIVENQPEKILIIRYLCEAQFVLCSGKQLSYNEVPSGPLYYRNFEGRCLKRAAFTFANDITGFRKIVKEKEERGLAVETLDKGDAGYRFEFLNGLYMSLLLWTGDEEFPPSAQMLFDDNFVFAFAAEDLAVVGEVAIRRLKSKAL
ncbi:hypothetical protein FACS1894200_13030 [Spirochaetia bacterium]|nr:hypothetical protein FACS1894200_13030 [Spirochaetia bacterium]